METDKINLDYVHANIPLAAVCVYKSILWRECGVNHPLRECTVPASVNNNLAKRWFLLQQQHKQRDFFFFFEGERAAKQTGDKREQCGFPP